MSRTSGTTKVERAGQARGFRDYRALERLVIPSLVLVAHLSSSIDGASGRLAVDHRFGRVSTIGFCIRPGEALFGEPPVLPAVPYARAAGMEDRFLTVAPSEARAELGMAVISEALVQDTVMRGPIDFTGLQVVLTLRPDAFERYRAFVRAAFEWTDDRAMRSAEIRFRLPSETFAFPAQRGSPDPWQTGRRWVGDLKVIKRLPLERMEVETLDPTAHRTLSLDIAARE